MAGLLACILDIDGAFLLGEFENGEQIYMRVPQGWEKYYPEGTILLLLKTIYGLKQAAMAFWRKLVRAITKMKMKRNSGDPCLYYSWREKQLSMMLSWVDDCLCIGSKKDLESIKNGMSKEFGLKIINKLVQQGHQFLQRFLV